jgi:Mn-dependent DtxR family transcriptional regulator
MEKFSAQDLINKLQEQGKVEYLNKNEHLKETEKIDESMERLKRRHYIISEDLYYPVRYST